MVHFFIFWDTKTRNKTHHWHKNMRGRVEHHAWVRAEITAGVLGVRMWGSWIIHKHVWLSTQKNLEKWLANVGRQIRNRNLGLKMLYTKCFLLSETPLSTGRITAMVHQVWQYYTFLSTLPFHSSHIPQNPIKKSFISFSTLCSVFSLKYGETLKGWFTLKSKTYFSS